MKDAAAPSGTPLPVEPERPFPWTPSRTKAPLHWRPEPAYQLSSSGFDVTFITPVLIHGGQNYSAQASRRDGGRGLRTPDREQTVMRPLLDFSNWSGYVAEVPPVLLVRVTPRLVEGFWMKVARGAAQTQVCPCRRSSDLPASRECARSAALSRSRQSTRSSSSTRRRHRRDLRGSAVFDPGALGPPCGSVS